MRFADFAVLSFGSLFTIVSPVAVVPAFLAMTKANSTEDRLRMARIAALVTFFVLVFFALAGHFLFGAFGITMTAFEIAGGVVLLKIALDMLQARRTAISETPEEQAEGIRKEDVAVTPLAVPMLAGPGAITAVILLAEKANGFWQRVTLMAVILAVSACTYAILGMAAKRSAIFSGITLKIITRLMGLLLAAIAVQFMLNGLAAFGLGKF